MIKTITHSPKKSEKKIGSKLLNPLSRRGTGLKKQVQVQKISLGLKFFRNGGYVS